MHLFGGGETIPVIMENNFMDKLPKVLMMKKFHPNSKYLIMCCSSVLFFIFVIYQIQNGSYQDAQIAVIPNSSESQMAVFNLKAESKVLPLTSQCIGGRLGNQMCSYATLYGLSALNHRRRFVMDCNKRHLESIFLGPRKAESIKLEELIKRKTWKLKKHLTPEDVDIPDDANILGGEDHACSFTFYDHVKNEILQEFQFKEHLQQHAQTILRQANVHHLHNPTYIGVHVRRTDFPALLRIMKRFTFDMEYFRKAIPYFREKYKNIVFVVVSDDRKWCIDNLSKEFGVYVSPNAPSSAHDLAVLANCNHTVITYGTFGYWGAYLAGGEVLYFDSFATPNTSPTLQVFRSGKMFPAHWKGIARANWNKSLSDQNSVMTSKSAT